MKSAASILLLMMLGACGPSPQQQPEGTSADSTAASEEMENTSSDPFIRHYNEGYDFYATGNEPFWNLAIDFQGNMKFSRIEMEDELIPVGQPIRAQDANVVMYRGNTENIEFEVTLSQNPCNDTMSDIQRPFSVRIRYKEDADYVNLQGCGNYLAEPRLHNIWAITELNGKTLDPADFNRGMPQLELFVRDGRLAGFDGCNRMMGWFYAKDGELYFGPIASTMMACPNMEIANELGKTLNSAKMAYEFQGSDLVLTRGENRVVLRPVD